MTTADYLNQLTQDRDDLVDNLETKGITGLTGDETFTELVPQVLNISGGGGLDWSAIGYSGTPQYIVDAYNYAKTIQNNWVDNTSKLTQTYPDVVICPSVSLGNRTSMEYFASGCTALAEVPLLNMSNITNAGNMFYNCTSLKTIPLLDTSAVTNTYNMFYGCSKLTSIPLIDTSKSTNTSNMFRSCTSLTTIPLIDTSSSLDMSYMFAGCTKLTSVPSLDTGKTKTMKWMFHSCTELTTVPELDTSAITNSDAFDGMFVNCTKLTDASLDNLLKMCINATSYTGTKTFSKFGFNSGYYASSKIQSLPSYQDFITAGWTIGY